MREGALENKIKEGSRPEKIRFRRAGDPRKLDLGGQGALENKV